MKQPWGVIDTDIHCVENGQAIGKRLPEPHRTRWAAGSRGPGHLGYWNPNGVMRSDTKLPDGSKIEASPEAIAEHFFDAYGLEYGIFNPGGLHFGVGTDPDYSAVCCAAINDTMIEDWLPVDARFRTSCYVAPNDPEQAAREIRRVGSHRGVVQVMMSSAARMPYGQRYYYPIYEAACELGLPVAIHPGTEGVGISYPPTPAGWPTTYFEWHTALACNYIGHLISLVTEGVFIRYPELTFVLVEGGVSWLPPLLWRLDKNWKALRISTPWLERPPSELVFEHIKLTTQPIEEPDNLEHLHQILAMFPAERMLMFSTDYPHWDGDTPDFAARLLPEQIRAAVMSGNARALYKLPEAVHA
ncbi:MAG: amidohydrolase [Armatimonadetes bacterium]|nr:amidohydrolase [Armatimonadota bacterium]